MTVTLLTWPWLTSVHNSQAKSDHLLSLALAFLPLKNSQHGNNWTLKKVCLLLIVCQNYSYLASLNWVPSYYRAVIKAGRHSHTLTNIVFPSLKHDHLVEIAIVHTVFELSVHYLSATSTVPVFQTSKQEDMIIFLQAAGFWWWKSVSSFTAWNS